MPKSDFFVPQFGDLTVRRGSGSGLASWAAYTGASDGAEAEWLGSDPGISFRLCALSSSLFVIAYITSNAATVVAGSVSGSTITFGTPVTVDNSVTVGFVDISAVSSSKFIITWGRSSSTSKYARTYTVSGTTITADSSKLTFANMTGSGTSTPDIYVTALSATRAIAVGVWSTTGTRAIGLTIGSGTLTEDAAAIDATPYENTGPQSADIDKISSTKAFLTTYGGYIITDNGSSLSLGTGAEVLDSSISFVHGIALSATAYAIAGSRGSGNEFGYGTISGSTITAQSFSAGLPISVLGDLIWADNDGSNDYLLAFGNGTTQISDDYGKVMPMKRDSNGKYTCYPVSSFTAANDVGGVKGARLSASQAVAIYSRGNFGKAKILNAA